MLLDKNRRELLRKELRDARLRADLRQVDVALMLGRPQSFVAKIENGERKVDFIDTLNFCKVVKLDPLVLIQKLG
jgi:transcriptional regulator with XRE-family HTH domain